ncbi:MAG: nucleotide sugar dehydrogenase [Rhodospirillales bacterium]|nr:nucleotide sugar dehydrogenase [Rhodospirillales bacterium]
MRVAVIGLGYVGLPLAAALSEHVETLGYDISEARIDELEGGHDRTGELSPERLAAARLRVTANADDIAGSDIFIVAVPTPLDEEKRPDLGAVLAAAQTVGARLAGGAIVVFESTVWPGVTEDICVPVLERASGLAAGVDFHVGYAPERMNPGDPEHGLDRLTKVIAGQTAEIAERLAALYGKLNGGKVFIARDIRTAEAAKVIENAQRDVNIAFINEVAQIFCSMGLSTHDVLDAARTKWNFLDFAPGLVGGHCIGVDPYYLAHRAVEIGHDPQIILAGRRTNDAMGDFIVEQIARRLEAPNGPVLVLGITFKENVSDVRNSQVPGMVAALKARGIETEVHDPHADAREVERRHGIRLLPGLEGAGPYACVLGAVAHVPYRALTAATFASLLAPGGLAVDIKNMWRDVALPDGTRRWTL